MRGPVQIIASSNEVTLTLGLQIAQSRSYLHTAGPKVGIIYILGVTGVGSS